jgi:hypothetical protein
VAAVADRVTLMVAGIPLAIKVEPALTADRGARRGAGHQAD